MQNREMQRDKQVAQMLFTLKIMFMLFSMFPVFEKAFGDRKSGTLTQVKPSLMGILILVAAVGCWAFSFSRPLRSLKSGVWCCCWSCRCFLPYIS